MSGEEGGRRGNLYSNIPTAQHEATGKGQAAFCARTHFAVCPLLSSQVCTVERRGAGIWQTR